MKWKFEFFDFCVYVILLIKKINLMEQVVDTFYDKWNNNVYDIRFWISMFCKNKLKI